MFENDTLLCQLCLYVGFFLTCDQYSTVLNFLALQYVQLTASRVRGCLLLQLLFSLLGQELSQKTEQ